LIEINAEGGGGKMIWLRWWRKI